MRNWPPFSTPVAYHLLCFRSKAMSGFSVLKAEIIVIRRLPYVRACLIRRKNPVHDGIHHPFSSQFYLPGNIFCLPANCGSAACLPILSIVSGSHVFCPPGSSVYLRRKTMLPANFLPASDVLPSLPRIGLPILPILPFLPHFAASATFRCHCHKSDCHFFLPFLPSLSVT